MGGKADKRRLLLITTRSLFGRGVVRLLDGKRDELVIEKVPDLDAAMQTCPTFRPDVVVYFRERGLPPEEWARLQDLVSRYHTRLIYCSLEANHLTIYDRTNIENATVDDLMAAVLNESGLEGGTQ